MPSLLKWNYLPGIADDEQPVEQRVYAGDIGARPRMKTQRSRCKRECWTGLGRC